MRSIWLNLQLLLRDLWAQRMRTLLTVFGIMWGTLSVILLLAFGEGVHRQNLINARGVGESVVIVWGGQTGLPYKGYNKGRSINLVESDVDLLKREIADIELISPEYSNSGAFVRGPKNVDQTNVVGVRPSYEDIRNVFTAAGGRFINEEDNRLRRRTVVLGLRLRDFILGKDKDVIGETITINDIPFQIVGVTSPKVQNSSYNTRDRDRAFIPAATFQAVFGNRYIANMVYKPTSAAVSKRVERRMYEVLGKRFTFNPDDEDALSVWDTSRFFVQFEQFFIGFRIFLGLIGSFTLTVGGVGVANIMYVVVKERTREIGVKRAVGARKSTILWQFISEAGVIVTMGAMMGFLLALLLIELLQNLPPDAQENIGTPIFSMDVAIASVLLLTIVTLISGFFPARRAAAVDPVVALRG